MKILNFNNFLEKLKINKISIDELNGLKFENVFNKTSFEDAFNKKSLETGTVVEFRDGTLGMFIAKQDRQFVNIYEYWPAVDLFLSYEKNCLGRLCYLRLDALSNSLESTDHKFDVVSIYYKNVPKSIYESKIFVEKFYEKIQEFIQTYPQKIKR